MRGTKILKSEITVLPGGTTSLKLQIAEGAELKAQLISIRAFSDGVVHRKEKWIPNDEKTSRTKIREPLRYDIIEAQKEGWVILSRERPGTIIETEAPEIFAAVTAFFASETDVQVSAYEVTNEQVKANCEAGDYWQRIKNPDKKKIFLGFDSGVITIPVEPDETVKVYHGYWLGMESGMKMTADNDDIAITNVSKKTKMVYIRSCNRPW